MKTYVMGFLCLFITSHLYSQDNSSLQISTSSETEQQLKNAISSYYENEKDYAAIFNAKMQEGYPRSIPNNPYFKDESYVKGTVCYDGILYKDIDLRLDLYKNELVTLIPSKLYNVVLESRWVEYVYLHNSYIVFIPDTGQKGFPGASYYIQLSDGEYKLLEKHTYTLDKVVEDRVKNYFRKSTKRYLCKDNVYYVVNNRKSVLNVFSDRKKELEQYIRQEDVSFSKDFVNAVIAVAKQYEYLTKN